MRVLALALACAGLAPRAWAQTAPDAGAIQRDIERQQQARPPAALPPATRAAEPGGPQPGEEAFRVQAFALEGVTLLPQADVLAALKPWLDRPLGFSALEQAKQAVVEVYEKHGWLVRAQLPEQDFADGGTVRLQVIEARLGAVRVQQAAPVPAPASAPSPEGEVPAAPALPLRLSHERIERTLMARQRTGDFLHVPHVERAIALLNETPGTGVSVSMAPGEAPGSTDLIVSAQGRSVLSGMGMFDNSGSRGTGASKALVSLNLDSPLGWGEQLGTSVMASEGVRYARLAASLPLGYDGWRLGANASSMHYTVVAGLPAGSSAQPQGTSQTAGLSLSWPWLRGASANANLGLSLDRKHFLNELHTTDATSGSTTVSVLSRKRLDVAGLSLGGDFADGQGGMNFWSLGWSAGQLDLSGNADNQAADLKGPQTEGRFNKLSYSLSRLQSVWNNASLWASLQGQRAGHNLDSSEKFVLGGAQAVRAYPTAEGTGDHGWLFTLEGRYNLPGGAQWVLFYDHGHVTANQQTWVGATAVPQATLRGWGSGISTVLAGRAQLRLSWARRIGHNPLASASTGMDGDGSLVRDRIWLSLNASL